MSSTELIVDPFVLSETEFDVLWRANHDQPLPLVLDVPSPGRTRGERADIVEAASKSLADKGLLTRHGEPLPRLRTALRVVAERAETVELRANLPHHVRALLAVAGRDAALIALVGGEVRIQPVPDTGIADTIVAVPAYTPPGPGHSVSVAVTAFAEAIRAPADQPVATLVRGGLGRDDAELLLSMTSGSVRIGQFAAAFGNTRRASGVVEFHDTPRGRYQSIRTITGATDYLTVTPASPASLARGVRELLAEVDQTRRATPG